MSKQSEIEYQEQVEKVLKDMSFEKRAIIQFAISYAMHNIFTE